MKTSCSNFCNAYWNRSITVWQWDAQISGKRVGNYFVIAANSELAEMQGVKPGHLHIECIVDDMGNLVRAAA